MHPTATEVSASRRDEDLRVIYYAKFEDFLNYYGEGKDIARMAADLDRLVGIATAVAQAPILHTLQAAAEVGFAQSGMALMAPPPNVAKHALSEEDLAIAARAAKKGASDE